MKQITVGEFIKTVASKEFRAYSKSIGDKGLALTRVINFLNKKEGKCYVIPKRGHFKA